ncbi:ninja-family protein 2-like [Solanum pennellii]|uniref:Ninja-family protein n=1 Tax=Solanum pennellii TaxID=28526 RepID=A0ABM1G3Y7_SOLPN|nr:ninja-family protein 2-like [Solanum pennellii]
MATPKGKTSTNRSDEQEIDLNLTFGGIYNTGNSNGISVPQPFSQIIASVAKNPAFQWAIEIMRSEINNNSKIGKICLKFMNLLSNSMEKGKSILLPESNGEKPSNKVKNFDNVVTSMNTSDLLRTMPCGTTSGGIINGKLTEGILYSGGEEKRISIHCICHGMFYTTAEFVKHGGGKEVDDPMKFIKVVDDA